MFIDYSVGLKSIVRVCDKRWIFFFFLQVSKFLLASPHLTLSRDGRLGTTDDFATSFIHFSLLSTALWDLTNSRPVQSLMSSHLFFCLPCPLPTFTVLCKMVLAKPDKRETVYTTSVCVSDKRETVYTTSVCVSLRWSGGLRVVRLPPGFLHGLPRW